MVILIADHKRILSLETKRLRRFYLGFITLVMVIFFVISPMLVQAPTPDRKGMILEAMRGYPVTIRQGLDIAETILSRSNEVPVSLILAVIQTESEFVFYAHSKKNCKGLFQLSPVVWKIYMGETAFKDHSNAYDPVLNLRVGLRYLADLYGQYGDWGRALAHFYCGNGNSKSRDVIRYVKAVLKTAKQLK